MLESAHEESERKIDFPSFTDRHDGKVAAEAAEARSMYVNMHVPIKINPSRPALTLHVRCLKVAAQKVEAQSLKE